MAIKKHSSFIYPRETALERSVTYSSGFLLCFRPGMETSQDLPLYLMVSEHPSISGTPDTWLPQVSKKALLGARGVAQFIECLLAPHGVLLLSL